MARLDPAFETYGISQNQLAIAMGGGRFSINRWVNENQDPEAEAVIEITKGLEKLNEAAGKEFLSLYLRRFAQEDDQASLLMRLRS